MQPPALVVNLTILLGAALVGGMVAHRLRQPVVLGYLVVGMATGPFALGLVTDPALVEAVAAIGVALLMFTLGLEVSFFQLMQVGRVGLWGGTANILLTFVLGLFLIRVAFQWSWPAAVLFGLIISLSSTTVALKVLLERGELDSLHGRITMAMQILQDISVIVMIIVLPVLGGAQENVFLALGTAVWRALVFIGAAVVLGVWVLPWLMGRVGGIRSRELFLLTVLFLSLGAALGTETFGLSAVFGAFLIGLVMRETRFAHQAVAEITPLRDIFAALFFVSLGMVLDPRAVLASWRVAILVLLMMLAIKFVAAFGVIRLFRYSSGISLLVAANLIPVSEFGFVLAREGVNTGILLPDSYSVIIGASIVTMLLAPFATGLSARLYNRLAGRQTSEVLEAAPKAYVRTGNEASVVIAGFGRVGQNIARGLQAAKVPYKVIELDPQVIFQLRCGGIDCVYGDASNARVLSLVELGQAKVLAVTFPDPLAMVNTVKTALMLNPDLKVIARVHSIREARILSSLGVTDLVSPAYEASLSFLERILATSGWSQGDVAKAVESARQDPGMLRYGPDEIE